MKRNIFLIMLGISLITTNLFARDLSINQAVSEALNKSSQILNQTLNVENAQLEEDGKYSSLYPTINLALTTLRRNSPIFGTTQIYTSLNGNISATISFNPAMITALKSTALQLKSQSITLSKAKSDLALQVKKLYYGILLQEASLKFQIDNIEYMETTLANTKEAYENGDIPELKVLQLQAQISSQIEAKEKSQNSIISQKRSLAFIIGADDITEPLNLSDSLPTTFNDDISLFTLDKAINSSNDLYATNIRIDLLDIQSQMLFKSTYIPSLTLSASYSPLIADITNWESYKNASDNGSISATLSFNLTNIIPGSSAQNNFKKLDISKEQLLSTQDTIRKNIVLTYSSYIEAINQAKRQISLSKENIELAQKSFDLTALSYENGDSSFSDLQSAQLSVSNAKISLLQSQYSYLSALLDLENQCTQSY